MLVEMWPLILGKAKRIYRVDPCVTGEVVVETVLAIALSQPCTPRILLKI